MTLTLNLFLIFTFFVIFTYVGLTFARRDFIVEHKNCTTRGCYPGIWGNCSVTKLPKGRTSLSLSTAIDIMLPNLFATVELYLVKPSSNEKYFIFNSSLADICALLRNRKPGNLIEVVFQMMKRNAQLPGKCPIMAGFYFIKDFEVDPEILPPYTPDAQFLANVLLYSKFNGSKPALLGIIIHEGMFRRKRKTATLPFPKFESARIRN